MINRIPIKLRRIWKEDKIYTSEKIYSQTNEELPHIQVCGKDDFHCMREFLEDADSELKYIDNLEIDELYVLFDQGDYFYLVDTGQSDFPVFYLTYENEGDFYLIKVASFDLFFNQLVPEEIRPVWDTDEQYYQLEKVQNLQLPTYLETLFNNNTAMVHGLLACVLTGTYEGINLIEEIEYFREIKLDEKALLKLGEEWEAMEGRLNMYLPEDRKKKLNPTNLKLFVLSSSAGHSLDKYF